MCCRPLGPIELNREGGDRVYTSLASVLPEGVQLVSYIGSGEGRQVVRPLSSFFFVPDTLPGLSIGRVNAARVRVWVVGDGARQTWPVPPVAPVRNRHA